MKEEIQKSIKKERRKEHTKERNKDRKKRTTYLSRKESFEHKRDRQLTTCPQRP